MANALVKKWLTSHLSLGVHYRIFYNVIAILTLLPTIYIYASTKKEIWIDHPLIICLGLAFMILGMYLFLRSWPLYDWREFAGIHQDTQPNLVITGLLKRVRHPLYLAGANLLIGFCLIDLNQWSFSALIITLLYIYVGTRLEEAKLVSQFGDQYRNFQNEVPMFLPRFRGIK
jgi:protein-S-isoprenylcysteine O-methyltransferase Ste14